MFQENGLSKTQQLFQLVKKEKVITYVYLFIVNYHDRTIVIN